jgi:hypothetical protein
MAVAVALAQHQVAVAAVAVVAPTTLSLAPRVRLPSLALDKQRLMLQTQIVIMRAMVELPVLLPVMVW